MSHFNGNQYPPVNQALHQMLTQLVDELSLQVDYPTKQVLMNSLHQNQQVINSLHSYVITKCRERGVDLTRPNNPGIHPFDLKPIVYDWVRVVLNQIRSQTAVPNYGGGMMQPPVQLGGYPTSPNAMYSSGPTFDAQPAVQVTPPQVQKPQQQYKQPTTPQTKEISLVENELITFSRDAGEDTIQTLDLSKGLELEDVPLGSTWNQMRVSINKLKSHRVEDGAFDAYRDLERMLPDQMKRGYWTHRLSYMSIGHIPLDTKTFLNLRDQIRKRYDAEKWRGVLEVLQDTSQGVWSKVDAYLTANLNEMLRMRLRDESKINHVIGITSVVDLKELCDPHFVSPLAESDDFPKTLEKLIDVVMREAFIYDTVVRPEKDNMAAVLKCRAVDYFKDGKTKFDYGMLPQEDRDALIQKLFSENTVLRLRRSLFATNTISSDVLERLKDPEVIVSPNHMGLFTQVVDQIMSNMEISSEEKLLPMPDAIVLNKQRVPPSEWLNIVKPIYPMGKKTMWLTGSDRLIGW